MTYRKVEELSSDHLFYKQAQKFKMFSKEEQLEKATEIFTLTQEQLSIALSIAQTGDYLSRKILRVKTLRSLHDTVIKNKKGHTYRDIVTHEELRELATNIAKIHLDVKGPSLSYPLINEYYICGHTKFFLINKFKDFAETVMKVDAIVHGMLNKVDLNGRLTIQKNWQKNRSYGSWPKLLSEKIGINVASVQSKYQELENACMCPLKDVLDKYERFQKVSSLLELKINVFAAANLKLVISNTSKLQINQDQLMDVIQEGNIALLDAIRQYNPELGCVFSTMAIGKIKRAIQVYFLNNESLIKRPHTVINSIKKIDKCFNDSASSAQKSFAQISKETGIPKAQVAKLMNEQTEVVYALNTSNDSNMDGTSGTEYLTDGNFDYHNLENCVSGPENADLTQGEMHDIYKRSNHVLNEQERKIIELRLGVDLKIAPVLRDFRKYTQYGLTAERIRQIQKVAVHKLQREVSKHV